MTTLLFGGNYLHPTAMKQMTSWNRIMTLAALVLVTGCGSEQSELAPRPGGSLNVSQGGAQDFAQFRAIIQAGGVPSPDLLDPVGFFAEHAMDLPPADCGQTICMHPSLAVAPRFDGGNWTMAFVAMNTPIDPADLERPPLHLVVTVEADSSLQSALSASWSSLAEPLRDEDRITLVSYGATAQVIARALPPAELGARLESLSTSPQANLFAGLATAHDEAAALDGHAGRVLLLTTGLADVGIVAPEHIVALGEQMASEGIALGVVGYGAGYDATLGSALGSLGAGSYSYAAGAADLAEVLTVEGETALFPLATSFEMRIEPAPGYKVGRIYGVERATHHGAGALLEMPALFIGQRSGASDVAGGRRGGGGGLFVELLADPSAQIAPSSPAYTLTASWNDAVAAQSQTIEVVNELAPGENPEGMWPHFSDPSQNKPFMVLNMYLAFKTSVELFEGGDCARAMGVIDMMAPSVEGWQGSYADPDIAEDYQLMLQLRSNLRSTCSDTISPRQPKEMPLSCFFI